jgi:hypothetical protein
VKTGQIVYLGCKVGRKAKCGKDMGYTRSVASTMARAAISRSTTSKWPFADAMWSGVEPSCEARPAMRGRCIFIAPSHPLTETIKLVCPHHKGAGTPIPSG